jgi:exosortase
MLLETSAVPVLREGNILRLPKTSLEVEQACSGVRSIVSLVTIGSVIAYLSHRSLGGRIALASLTVPLAVAANAVRVAALGIGAYYYGVDIDRPLLHEAAGVAIFAATCSTLFVADRRLPSW